MVSRPLHLAVLYNNLRFSGGRKVLHDYAVHLRRQGHQVAELALSDTKSTNSINAEDVRAVSKFDRNSLPECDFLIASEHDEVRAAVASGRGQVVHFCQGFEIDNYEFRLEHNLLPERYQTRKLFRGMQLWLQRRKWKRRIREFDAIYRLPTRLVAVSKELAANLQSRYRRKVQLAENGICPDVFYPPENWPDWNFDAERPCRVLCVGNSQLLAKGIRETSEAVRWLKSRNLPVHFVRVCPRGLSDAEHKGGVVDEFHSSLSATEMGDLYRSCHAYVSNSHPSEGFGLPAMEALRSGMVTTLTDIPCYRSYADHRQFTHFVPVRDSLATAKTLLRLMASKQPVIDALRLNALETTQRFTLENARRNFESALLRMADDNRKPNAKRAA